MNKCNVPKKKILVLSNSKFSQDTVIVFKKADECYIECQRMTTSDKKWQWVAANDSGTTNEKDTVHLKNGWLPFFLWQNALKNRVPLKNECIRKVFQKGTWSE